MKLKILPAIYYFEEGKVKDKMIGFEEFGNKDDFSISSLKVRLGLNGAIPYKKNFKL